MKNRFSIGMFILLILFGCGILFKAGSQAEPTPPYFRVAVVVNCNNEVHQSQVEDALKRELRSFGDVQIVEDSTSDPLWMYKISIQLFGITEIDGGIHRYAISQVFYQLIPNEHFKPGWQEWYKKYPAVTLPMIYTGLAGINQLEGVAKTTAANFDESHLQPVRDLLELK